MKFEIGHIDVDFADSPTLSLLSAILSLANTSGIAPLAEVEARARLTRLTRTEVKAIDLNNDASSI